MVNVLLLPMAMVVPVCAIETVPTVISPPPSMVIDPVVSLSVSEPTVMAPPWSEMRPCPGFCAKSDCPRRSPPVVIVPPVMLSLLVPPA